MVVRVCKCRLCCQVPGLRCSRQCVAQTKWQHCKNLFLYLQHLPHAPIYMFLPTYKLTKNCLYFGCKCNISYQSSCRWFIDQYILMQLCYSFNNSIGKKQNTTTKATRVITQTTTSIWPPSQSVPELPFLRPLHHWRCILFWNLARQLLWNATLSKMLDIISLSQDVNI